MTTPLTDEEINDIRRRAAQLLRERGHTKLQLCDDLTGAMCVMGAVNTAITGEPLYDDDDESGRETYRNVAAAVAGELWPDRVRHYDAYTSLNPYTTHPAVTDLVHWNNQDHVNADDVIEALEPR